MVVWVCAGGVVGCGEGRVWLGRVGCVFGWLVWDWLVLDCVCVPVLLGVPRGLLILGSRQSFFNDPATTVFYSLPLRPRCRSPPHPF